MAITGYFFKHRQERSINKTHIARDKMWLFHGMLRATQAEVSVLRQDRKPVTVGGQSQACYQVSIGPLCVLAGSRHLSR